VVIESTRFGTLEVDEKDIISFSEGLPGFPDEKSFIFLPYGPESPFAFLQSVTEPSLTFLIVEPFAFFADYQFEIEDALLAELELSEGVMPQIYSIITVPDNLEAMTANLLAPLIFNRRGGKAAQIILTSSPYTTAHRLFPNGFPKQGGKRRSNKHACTKP
jgi:flagellar assembly factor FliW